MTCSLASMSSHLTENQGAYVQAHCWNALSAKYWKAANDEIRSLPISSKRTRGRPKKPAGPVRAAPLAAEEIPLGQRLEVPFFACISCTEDGKVNVAEAYCEECVELLCEEHRRAHAKTRLTKSHKVIHVRDMRLTDEVQEPEEPMVAEQPLVLEEPVEHDVLAVATEVRSLREKRTRHPPTRASKRKKITDLID